MVKVKIRKADREPSSRCMSFTKVYKTTSLVHNSFTLLLYPDTEGSMKRGIEMKMRRILWSFLATFGLVTAGVAIAQGMGEGGYGAYGGSYGMMGGYGGTNDTVTFSQAKDLLTNGATKLTVDKLHNTVEFRGAHVNVVMAAVQPGFPDTTFEVAGLVDPTIIVPASSTVTLTLVNMDYGANMDHGVVITPLSPPYPVLGMMGIPDAWAGIRILPPRDQSPLTQAHFPEQSVTFAAPNPGVYYYLCQYHDHASKGMYGRFVVKG